MENSFVVNAFVKHFDKVHLTYEAVGEALEALTTVSRDDIDNLMDHLITNATPSEFLGICVNVGVGGLSKTYGDFNDTEFCLDFYDAHGRIFDYFTAKLEDQCRIDAEEKQKVMNQYFSLDPDTMKVNLVHGWVQSICHDLSNSYGSDIEKLEHELFENGNYITNIKYDFYLPAKASELKEKLPEKIFIPSDVSDVHEYLYDIVGSDVEIKDYDFHTGIDLELDPELCDLPYFSENSSLKFSNAMHELVKASAKHGAEHVTVYADGEQTETFKIADFKGMLDEVTSMDANVNVVFTDKEHKRLGTVCPIDYGNDDDMVVTFCDYTDNKWTNKVVDEACEHLNLLEDHFIHFDNRGMSNLEQLAFFKQTVDANCDNLNKVKEQVQVQMKEQNQQEKQSKVRGR